MRPSAPIDPAQRDAVQLVAYVHASARQSQERVWESVQVSVFRVQAKQLFLVVAWSCSLNTEH